MMVDSANQSWALQPLIVTVTDEGRTFTVGDVQRWDDERKKLLRQARDILEAHNGSPVSLYSHYGSLVSIARRLDQIRVIFEAFNRERNRHADANIRALVAYFSDPKTMAGIDD